MNTKSAVIEMEKSVLGTVLIDADALNRIGNSLKSEDFFLEEHKQIAQAIDLLRVTGKDVNILSVLSVLEKSNSSINREFLESLTNYMVDPVAALTFSTQITESAGLRYFFSSLELLQRESANGIQLPEVISHLNNLTNKLATKSFAPTEKYGELLEKDFLELFKAKRTDWKLIGIPEVDTKIYDFAPGEVVVFAARPGGGKTAAMLQSARVQVASGKTVGFITMEMAERKLLQRLISARSGVPGDQISKMELEEFMMDESLVESLQFFVQNEQLIIDTGAPHDIDTIERVIRKFKYVHKVDIVYVDYIQLIEASSFGKDSGNRNQELTAISRKLKNLATELEIGMVCAAQLNREAVKRGSQGPLLSDLRDSGAIEQDASVVIFLYPYVSDTLSEDQREDYLSKATELTIKFEIAKQRNGPVWVFELNFVKPIGVFRSSKDTMFAKSDFSNDDNLPV